MKPDRYTDNRPIDKIRKLKSRHFIINIVTGGDSRYHSISPLHEHFVNLTIDGDSFIIDSIKNRVPSDNP